MRRREALLREYMNSRPHLIGIERGDIPGLPCAEVDSERAERRRVLVLRSAAEDVRSPGNLDPSEAAFSQERDELCFQQSAGDSTSP